MTKANRRQNAATTLFKTPALALAFLVAVALMLVANPTKAFAGEAHVEASFLGAKLVYEDDTGNNMDNNDVMVEDHPFFSNTFAVRDAGEPVTAGPGCSPVANDPHAVTCIDLRMNAVFVDVWRGPDKVVASTVDEDVTVYGGSGDDFIDTAWGNDTIHSDRSCLLNATSGCSTRTPTNSIFPNFADEVYAGPGNDVIEGGTGDDELDGGIDNDIIDGDAPDLVTQESPFQTSCDYCGDDLLVGGPGVNFFTEVDADTLKGNGGIDTADYSGRWTAAVTVTLDGQDNDGEAGEGDSVGQGNDIENVVGGKGNDSLTGDAWQNVLEGGEGSDALDGKDGFDTLDGGDGPDSLFGGGHDDTLIPGAGAGDGVLGGDGTDTASYSERTSAAVNVSLDGSANDGASGEGDNIGVDVETVVGGSAGDILSAGAQAARLVGGIGGDTLTGGPANDRLEGEADFDVLDGRGGADFMSGGTGQDRADYSSRTADLSITADEGSPQSPPQPDGEFGEGDNVRPDIETVWGGSGDDEISGSDTNMIVNNPDGDPVVPHTLLGNGGDDDLDGGAGGDSLQGGDGNDILAGWRGADSLKGGNGSDTVSARGHDFAKVDLTGQTLTGQITRYLKVCDDQAFCSLDPAAPEATTDALEGIENTAGSPGNDELLGNTGDNVLDGAGGDDTLHGAPGTDTLSGGGGDDYFDNGPATPFGGADTFNGGDGRDVVDFKDAFTGVNVSLDGVANDGDADTSGRRDNVGADVERVIGSTNGDTLVGNDSPNTLEGGAGNDTVRGAGGDDTMDAGDGDDALDGGTGAETMSGGPGTDTADYSPRAAAVSVSLDGQPNDGASGEGDDVSADIETILGGSGGDTLAGEADRERLEGRAGNDALSGAGGNDLLFGGAGGDDLNGGAGADDQVDYGDHSSGVTVTQDGVANDGNASDERGGTGGRDNVAGDVEEVRGSDFNDYLSGDGGRDELFGSGGADTLGGLGGEDVLVGFLGNDTLNGGDGNDDFWGDTYLSGGGQGADTYNGGDGQDRASWVNTSQNVTVKLDGLSNDGLSGEGDNVEPNVENVSTGSGNDTIVGGPAANDFASGFGNDTLDGGDGGDVLTASDGIDILKGGPGADALEAGEGNDFVTGGPDGDGMDGGAGTDTTSYDGHDGNIVLDLGATAPGSGPGGDTLNGFENAIGGAGNDTLLGDGANNQLEGGNGDDAFDGRGGADSMKGGDGDDTADYTKHEEGVSVSLGGTADDGGPAEGDNVMDDVETVLGTPANDFLAAAPERGAILAGNGGDDQLAGSTDADTLRGGGGKDLFDAGEGDDILRARDGLDEEVICGPGADLAGLDLLDVAAEDCETIEAADPPHLTIDDPTATEGTDPNALFTVSLSASADDTIEVAYTTAGGTALAGEDYKQSEGTLTFVPGDTEEKIPVQLVDDGEKESDEEFHVELPNASGAETPKVRGTATIKDDDGPPPDTVSPQTTITGGPSGPTRDDTPTFTYEGWDDKTPQASLLFSHRVDGGGWSPYSSATSTTLASLPEGPHTFYVRAKDEAGNEDASPAERSLRVDTTAPRVESVTPTGKKVSPGANVTATFSEAMEGATIKKGTFTLVKKGTTTKIGATVTYNAVTDKAVLDPTANLKPGVTYRATVTSGVTDRAGNALDQNPSTAGNQPKTWTFKVRR